MVKDFPSIKVIASGGVSSADEVRLLEASGVYGAIIGKALYEGKIKLDELKEYLSNE
jgi:phosphoribosylformimino-5-aminoimidazole carboxamide ribotide isomerase